MRFLSNITAARSTCVQLDDADARKLLSQPHTSLEVLVCPDGDPAQAPVGKMYLDRDLYLGSVMNEPPTQSELADHLVEVQQNVHALLDRLRTDDNNLIVRIATRHGWCPKHKKHKASFRPFILGMSIRYTDIPKVIRFMGQEDFWDMSVYKPNEQLLASINGCKGVMVRGGVQVHDGRILTPAHEEDDVLDYVVQHVLTEWELLDLPQNLDREAQVRPSVEGPPVVKNDFCATTVSALVACLSKRTSDDRKTWIAVAIALKNVGGDELFPDFHAFSQLSSKYDGMHACKKTWDSLPCGDRQRGTSSGIGTLWFHAGADNPRACTVVRRADNERRRSMAMALLEDGRLTSGIGTENDEDHLGPLRTALIKLHPAFKDITRAGFSSTPLGDGRTIQFNDPTLLEDVRMVLPTSVRIAGVLIGEVAPGLQIDDMHRFLVQIPRVTRFNLRCDENGDDMTLVDCNDSNSHLDLFDINKKPRGHVGLSGTRLKEMTLCNAKSIVDDVKKQVFKHIDSTLGTPGGTTKQYFHITFNQTVNNMIVVANQLVTDGSELGDPKKPNDFELTRVKLQTAGARDNLRKLDGNVYEPVEGCPCAYMVRQTYPEFINTELCTDEVFQSNPRRFDDLISYLNKYEVKELPTLKPDRDLLSFSNGVLQLATGVFTDYDGLDPDTGLSKRVARHHIPHPYTACEDTPLLDTILDAQFEHDVAQVLCALLGRTLFKVGQLDTWQVMPFIVGVGGTGKSLLLKIVERMFACGAVGNLSAKREEVYEMANLVDKELVMGRDMPAKMSASLPQDTMQSMTAGEGMEIPRKGLTALQVQWSSPVVMAGNHMPDYINTGNNVGRRMVSIRFDNTVKNPQEDLERLILENELPNIVCRFLGAYCCMRKKVTSTMGGFWKSVPDVVLEWRGMLTAATNRVQAFLDMDSDRRGFTIEYVEGAITWELDFIAVYESKNGAGVPYVSDTTVFESRGFEVSKEKVQMCKTCKAASKGRPDPCCPSYSRNNRGLKTLIYNMRMKAVGEEVALGE